jgi:hypothetical protein
VETRFWQESESTTFFNYENSLIMSRTPAWSVSAATSESFRLIGDITKITTQNPVSLPLHSVSQGGLFIHIYNIYYNT